MSNLHIDINITSSGYLIWTVGACLTSTEMLFVEISSFWLVLLVLALASRLCYEMETHG